jgi:hypothetical protein
LDEANQSLLLLKQKVEAARRAEIGEVASGLEDRMVAQSSGAVVSEQDNARALQIEQMARDARVSRDVAYQARVTREQEQQAFYGGVPQGFYGASSTNYDATAAYGDVRDARFATE